MYNRNPWPLKKSKSWGPFWSYQLNSIANSAHFAQFLGKLAINILRSSIHTSIVRGQTYTHLNLNSEITVESGTHVKKCKNYIEYICSEV